MSVYKIRMRYQDNYDPEVELSTDTIVYTEAKNMVEAAGKAMVDHSLAHIISIHEIAGEII